MVKHSNHQSINVSINPQSLLVRSLRRRLWKALQEEDIKSAYRAYTVSKDEYRKWLDEEIDEGERLQIIEEEKVDSIRKERRGSRVKNNTRKRGSECKRRIKEITKNSSAAKAQKEHIFKDNTIAEDNIDNDFMDFSEPILQKRFHPGDEFIRDDFLGPYDSYDTTIGLTATDKRKKDISKKTRRKSSRKPRMAGLLTPWKSTSRRDEWDLSDDFMRNYNINNNNSVDHNNMEKVDENMTTLMHEASRVASAGFIRLLLDSGGNPNTRNGQQRTALHMVAGGILEQELRSSMINSSSDNNDLFLIQANDNDTGADKVGIQAPEVELFDDEKKEKDQPRIRKKAARAMSKIFHRGKKKSEIDSSVLDNKNNGISSMSILSADKLAQLKSERMDALLAILSWVHPDDGTAATGEGPSINSVDVRGRTALHYAAELGRMDLSLTILTSFGAILTVVDDTGRTPCELAAEQGHPELAAHLEARALLYTDPWVDEEVMRNVWGGSSDDEALYFDIDAKQKMTKLSARSKLAAPFSWFETWDAERVETERQERTGNLLEMMHTILKEKQEEKETTEFMYNHGIDDSVDEYMVGFNIASVEIETNDKEGVTKDSITKDPDENAIESTTQEQGNKKDAICPETAKQAESVKPLSEYQILLRIIKTTQAELLATYHSWDISAAINAFKSDPVGALQKVGIDTPHEVPQKLAEGDQLNDRVCLICCDDFAEETDMWYNLSECDHSFCIECLQDYVSERASSNRGLNITCPHHSCSTLISLDEVKKFSKSDDIYKSLVSDANEKFVSTADDLRFCPHPGCNGIVRRCLQPITGKLKADADLINLTGAVCTAVNHGKNDDDTPLTYEGVPDARYILTRNKEQPKRGHRFCFDCGSSMHWPVPCDTLEMWREKIAEEIGEVRDENDEGTGEDFNDVAQKLWIKANTRPCPKCKAPIEKNDGCNHMICSNRNCRHEFCWICREDWKLHSTETGGFFRCNRWKDDDNHNYYESVTQEDRTSAERNTVDENGASEVNYGTALHSSRAAWKKSKEMGLFLHHYRRWTAHSESAALERQMADTACERLAPVVEAAIDFNGHENFDFGGKGLSFVHGAFTELLECRSLLQHSYAFAFFRYPIQYHIRKNRIIKNRAREKVQFDQLQAELETITEQMSDIVARKHLRATQMQIMFLTKSSYERRNNLNNLMISLLDRERKEKVEESERLKKEREQVRSIAPNGMESVAIGVPTQQSPNRDEMSIRYQRLISGQLGQFDNFDRDDTLLGPNRGRMDFDDDMLQFLPPSVYQVEEIVDRFQDWACSDCTYMNAGGRQCAICGNARS